MDILQVPEGQVLNYGDISGLWLSFMRDYV